MNTPSQWLLTGVSSLIIVSQVAADETAAKTGNITSAQDPVAMANLWQISFGMVLVIGLILGMSWLLKRSGRFQVGAGGGLRVIGGLSMGTRERVVLLQVGEQQLLVGVAPGRVQMLHVLDQPLGIEAAAPVSVKGFADQLGRFMKKGQQS